ncbi:MAG: histidine phosphatase family protein [Lachnospiraceae bacterium]|nr:histidine phosphatase family protein [Lachnospiraceae bacterium]
MRNESTVKINIIRHGKTPLNEKHCYIGSTDESLSDVGIKEIEDNVKKSVYKKTDRVFVSPMKRAMETSRIIYPNASVNIIDEFREMDFGSFEGKNYNELKDDAYYRKWIDESRGIEKDEIDSLYGGLVPANLLGITLPESMESFKNRTINGLKKVINLSKGEDATIVAHGGTIMMISSLCLDGEYYNYMVKNGDGVEAEIAYTDNNGNIEISRVSLNNRICS